LSFSFFSFHNHYFLVSSLDSVVLSSFPTRRSSDLDPISATVGGKLSEDALQQRRDALGLDEPLIVQYGQFLKDVVTLNFGQTITDNRAIIDIVKDNGGATLTLAASAFAIALLIGLPLGRLAGRMRDSAPDVFIRILGIITYAAPVFYWGLLFQLLFAGALGWLPSSGMASPETTFEVSPVT